MTSNTPETERGQNSRRDGEVASSYDRGEEYRRAQQAAVEAVAVGRETLATAVHQGEQLQNAERMLDDTEYTVDKANRVLRGMTWSGWLANKFSSDVDSPEYRNNNHNDDDDDNDAARRRSILGPPKSYEAVPDSCLAASQSVQNYHANLQVLESCETEEQKGTCRLICNNMHRQARRKITEVLARFQQQKGDEDPTSDVSEKAVSFALELQKDVSTLRQRQLVLQQVHTHKEVTAANNAAITGVKTKLFQESTRGVDAPKIASPADAVMFQQEQHLNTMTQHLQELGSLAGNLNITLQQQSEVLDSLDDKNDTVRFKTNLMNRKTERHIKDKSWGKQRAEFSHYAWIRHQTTGCYLSVATNSNSVMVLSKVLNERCIFGIYKKRRVFGLQNKYNRMWVGQSLLGQLACSASSFGRREEWEADGDDWSDTTLLVVSAGWGTGGYLLLDKEAKGTQPMIGGGDLLTKKLAPKWCINEFNER